MEFNDGTYEIIGSAMRVHNELGPGLREKPYENALMIDFREQVIPAHAQKPYPILYHGKTVGDCVPDITVNQEVLVDAKSIEKIGENEISPEFFHHFCAGLFTNFAQNSDPFRRSRL